MNLILIISISLIIAVDLSMLQARKSASIYKADNDSIGQYWIQFKRNYSKSLASSSIETQRFPFFIRCNEIFF